MNGGVVALTRVVCTLAVVLMSGIAQAGLVLDWQFQEAEVELGQSAMVVLSDTGITEWDDVDQQWSTMTEVEDDDLGLANAELQIRGLPAPFGVWLLEVSAAIDMTVNEDPGGAINFSHSRTYFQLAVTVSDQPYVFDMDYELDDPSAIFITQTDHFVNQYGSGSVLYPRVDPYVLLWGAMDYTTTGFGFSGWEYLCAHAETDVTLSIIPVPEPTGLCLLGFGSLLAVLGRFPR